MKPIISQPRIGSAIEPLESRIAPASLAPLLDESGFESIVSDNSLSLTAGQGLSKTGDTSGAYYLYVLKGNAKVFTTDFNNNGEVDFNEITGISAGDGLQMIIFTDIHGDIVTNLNADGKTLTDSDNNADNGQDGRVLLNSRIELIEMRSLQASDISPTKNEGKSINTVAEHTATSSHSIYGGIYAGGGLGFADVTNTTGGLWFGPGSKAEVSSVGPIKVGTAASGQHFSFGASFGGPVAPETGTTGTNGAANSDGDVQGVLTTFTPLPGQTGANINGIHAIDGETPFNITTIQAGDGGFGAAGGSIANVTITEDNSGGYKVLAGNGGRGQSGGAGGAIINFSDLGSVTSNVIIKSGNGGRGVTGAGGAGGTISFGVMNLAAGLNITTGSGGDGFTNGGAGASLVTGVFSAMQDIEDPTSLAMVGTTRNLDPILIDPLYVDPTSVGATTMVQSPIGVNPHPVSGMPSNFWPSLPSMGTTQAIDFDHDGYGDVVFTTSTPDQVVVLFGNGGGGYDFSKTLFLDAPVNPGALTVGDFNNDGHPDIAVASSSASFSGVSVFLSQYGEINAQGALTKFTGFSDALQSTFPVVVNPQGADDAPNPTQIPLATKVLRMVIGDFNGDQINDIAVQLQFVDPVQGNVTKLLFLDGDIDERGFGSGYFYGDFGNEKHATVSPYYPAAYPLTNLPVTFPKAPTGPLKASTFKYDFTTLYSYQQNQDFAFIGKTGDKDDSIIVVDHRFQTSSGPVASEIGGLGVVDTNRKYPDTSENISKADATLQDFAVLDINGDGTADLVALTLEPTGMLVTFQGGGLYPSFTLASSPDGDQNAGISISNRGGAPTQPANYGFSGDVSISNQGTQVGIIATSVDGDGVFDDIAILGKQLSADLATAVYTLKFTHVNELAPGTEPESLPVIHSVGSLTNVFACDEGLPTSSWYDTYSFDLNGTLLRPLAGTSTMSYGVMLADSFASKNSQADPSVLAHVGFADYHYVITTGNGGNGKLGSGGAAGSMGAGKLKLSKSLTSNSVVSDLSILFDFPTTDPFYWYVSPSSWGMGVDLRTGNGGNGFINGGAGGTISGVGIEGNWTARIQTGNGGDGFSGTGGAGGDLKANHVDPAERFTAGDGGNGYIGGNGGSIIGNGLSVSAGFLDAHVPYSLDLTAGDGGDGIKKGGNGGGILNFTPTWDQNNLNPARTGLSVSAGDGGSAAAGIGGAGGSVISSGPVGLNNFLKGDINVAAGYGGDGLTGGAGGSIANFWNNPTDDAVKPGALSFVAGNGGNGISGNGGAGGGIASISVAGLGASKNTGAKFNRVIAGHGGTSAGAAGGYGGTISSVDVSSESGAMVIVAGAGGQGLTSGGAGGSVIETSANSSGYAGPNTPIGKVVVIAGEGGNTLASLPFNHVNSGSDPTEEDILKSFGGLNGKAGNGGSILSFVQPVGDDTVVDLIAGNGGNTINYGTFYDTVGGVGRGGSISGKLTTTASGKLLPNISGSIGNSDKNVAIKAYNNTSGDYRADETMRSFVDRNFRDSEQINYLFVDDDLGNVGLVAGAAGRMMNDVAASYAVNNNGSVSNLILSSTSKVLSMVAGAVDKIAKIQSISGVRLDSGGSVATSDLGADKAVVPAGSAVIPRAPAYGTFDYYDANGLVQGGDLVAGFGLIDGVIFAKNIAGLHSAQ